MEQCIKKNINIIVALFILIQPILDLLTGLCLHLLKINLTIGIIVRILFLIFICFIVLFTFKKKNILVPYFIIGLYFIFYLLGIILFKETGFYSELQGLLKVFYFPILLISLYSIKDEIRISEMTLFTTLLIYLILIFIPLLLGIGYKTYEITKAGTLGFFNSANEISGIISLLTPIMFIIIKESNKLFSKITVIIIYLVVILMIGTKTPLLTLGITTVISLIYFLQKSVKEKKIKNIIVTILIVLTATITFSVIIPKTNFYKNIRTHLDYLELDNITEVFTDIELVDHFIFSQRLTFLRNKATLYQKSSLYQKLFGIGYLKNEKATKLIEMDYFDILFSHGIIGFIIFFGITLKVILKISFKQQEKTFERYMLNTSFILIIFLAFFTGHIITAPSVSLISIILILSLLPRIKKDLLFADKNMEIGGIETAQINLLNSLDYHKYNVTLILEEKKGTLLSKINSNVIIKELKVNNNEFVPLRKIINVSRKFIFKIFNYHNFDFSCCYTTYSYSCNKIAKLASKNNSFYVHSDYKNVYRKKEDFTMFFDTRKVSEYKNIIFVSNEAKESFIKYYPNLENKSIVLNNLVNTKEIIEKSKEKILEVPPKNKTLLVFVGRLDDSSKKLRRAINLVKEVSNTHLWIIGDGPDKDLYKEYAKEVKVTKNIDFIGRKENPYPFMQKADYIILTSDYEGFPVTYLEALTLKKQIITTISTSDDLIDMKDYAHIISKDDKKMIKEVSDVINNHQPKKLLDLNKIQQNRLKQFERIFDSENN